MLHNCITVHGAKIIKFCYVVGQIFIFHKDFLNINPLPHLFKALLQGQKDHVFFSGHLIYILQQERFRAFRQARNILNPERFGALGTAEG
jgi:hypothetical protein